MLLRPWSETSRCTCFQLIKKTRTPVIIDKVLFLWGKKMHTKFYKSWSLKKNIIKRALGSKGPRPTCPRWCQGCLAALKLSLAEDWGHGSVCTVVPMQAWKPKFDPSTHTKVVWQPTHAIPAQETGDRDGGSIGLAGYLVRDPVFKK